MIRVAPYARISDTDEDRAPGLDRQLRIVYPLIESRGGTPTHEYVDNDKSAYDDTVIRDEGFEPWLKDFIAGNNDGIAAFDLDRLFRQPADLERVIKAYKVAARQGRNPVFWLPSMTLDLTDEDGQTIARMLVAVANASSGKTAKRIVTFYRDEALKGNIFSNYPAFYRNPDGTINPEKQAIIMKAIDDILNFGIRPTAVAQEWRDKGITTARGGRATAETVRRILVAPGIAGFAVYKGEILMGEDGQPIKRIDGGIVDEATWRQLIEKIRVRPKVGDRREKGLLTKTLRCGRCGSGMTRATKPTGMYYYNCRSVDSGGCGCVSISGPKLEQQITAEVLSILSEPYEPPTDIPFEGEERLAEVTDKIAELMQSYLAGGLSGSIVFPVIKKLEDEQRSLQAAAAKHRKKQRPVILTAAEQWDLLDFAQKQGAIAQLFEVIVIKPSSVVRVKGKQTGYDPNRVQIIRRSLSPESLYKLYASVRSSLALAA
jgi:site-specific DNA recombinase